MILNRVDGWSFSSVLDFSIYEFFSYQIVITIWLLLLQLWYTLTVVSISVHTSFFHTKQLSQFGCFNYSYDILWLWSVSVVLRQYCITYTSLKMWYLIPLKCYQVSWRHHIVIWYHILAYFLLTCIRNVKLNTAS